MVAANTVSSLEAVILIPSSAVSLSHFAKLQKLLLPHEPVQI
jgi:hypothetical protein